jgi:hypothetical protein
VLDDAVEGVQELRARRARRVLVGGARVHHAVDDERVLAGREQPRERHLGRAAVRQRVVEDVVLGYDAARRQLPSGRGDGLDRAAQLGLLLEQPIARGPVLGRLSWEGDAHRRCLLSAVSRYRQDRSPGIVAR